MVPFEGERALYTLCNSNVCIWCIQCIVSIKAFSERWMNKPVKPWCVSFAGELWATRIATPQSSTSNANMPLTWKTTSLLGRHMNSEHNAYYGLEYLLAGCTMSNEERMAVREVTRWYLARLYLFCFIWFAGTEQTPLWKKGKRSRRGAWKRNSNTLKLERRNVPIVQFHLYSRYVYVMNYWHCTLCFGSGTLGSTRAVNL